MLRGGGFQLRNALTAGEGVWDAVPGRRLSALPPSLTSVRDAGVSLCVSWPLRTVRRPRNVAAELHGLNDDRPLGFMSGEVSINPLGRFAAVAHSVDHQARTAHKVAAGENAGALVI